MLKSSQANIENLEKYIIENKNNLSEKDIEDITDEYIIHNINHYKLMAFKFGKTYTIDMIEKDIKQIKKIIKNLI